jgi:hypothetical protein
MKYKFIDIGCGSFDVSSDYYGNDVVGIYVEPIKEYLDVSVKNDDALIKLAAIVQRMMKNESDGDGGGLLLSEEEKKQLMEAMNEVEKDLPKEDGDE